MTEQTGGAPPALEQLAAMDALRQADLTELEAHEVLGYLCGPAGDPAAVIRAVDAVTARGRAPRGARLPRTPRTPRNTRLERRSDA